MWRLIWKIKLWILALDIVLIKWTLQMVLFCSLLSVFSYNELRGLWHCLAWNLTLWILELLWEDNVVFYCKPSGLLFTLSVYFLVNNCWVHSYFSIVFFCLSSNNETAPFPSVQGHISSLKELVSPNYSYLWVRPSLSSQQVVALTPEAQHIASLVLKYVVLITQTQFTAVYNYSVLAGVWTFLCLFI